MHLEDLQVLTFCTWPFLCFKYSILQQFELLNFYNMCNISNVTGSLHTHFSVAIWSQQNFAHSPIKMTKLALNGKIYVAKKQTKDIWQFILYKFILFELGI